MKTLTIYFLAAVVLVLTLMIYPVKADDSMSDIIRINIAKYRAAVQKNPQDSEAQWGLASSLYATNDKQVGNAIHLNMPSVPMMDEAIRHLQAAVALKPNNPDWQGTLGTYLSNRGRYAEALPHYKQALYLRGSLKPFLIGRGGDFNQAQRAEMVCSERYLLGDTLAKLGRNSEAVWNYRQALQFHPNDAWVLLGLGDALNSLGKTADARNAWRKIVSNSLKESFYTRQARKRLSVAQVRS